MTASKVLSRKPEYDSVSGPPVICPNCAPYTESVLKMGKTPSCAKCGTEFPSSQNDSLTIPWLFPNPTGTRLEWKARFNGFLHANSLDLERLRDARNSSHNSEAGGRRISRLLHAREQYRRQICSILEPMGLEGINWPADSAQLLHSKLPKNQGLLSYHSNIFRDWVWNNGENDALLDAVASVLAADLRDGIGSLLTLGAGACRLPYDIHRFFAPDVSVMLELNPLLLQISARVIRGDTVPLYEFPIAPLNESSFAVLQECKAPEPLPDSNMKFVLADALNPPFPNRSFDTILTPWLIDIVPQNLRTLIPRLNRMLTKDGVWVNTGSLAFFHRDESWCYSEEEVLELVAECGFEILASERRTVPYLRSPHSSHGRTENILSFAARKVRHVERPVQEAYLPDWILDTGHAVPASPESAISSSNHMLTAQVLASIDGKRTIKQIGRMIARQYGLGVAETTHAVTRIIIDAWDVGELARLN